MLVTLLLFTWRLAEFEGTNFIPDIHADVIFVSSGVNRGQARSFIDRHSGRCSFRNAAAAALKSILFITVSSVAKFWQCALIVVRFSMLRIFRYAHRVSSYIDYYNYVYERFLVFRYFCGFISYTYVKVFISNSNTRLWRIIVRIFIIDPGFILLKTGNQFGFYYSILLVLFFIFLFS